MLARGKLNRLNGHTKYFSGRGMDIIYVDIMTGKILSSIKVATLVLIYLSVISSNNRGRDGVIVSLSSWKNNIIRVVVNMVQHPSNYISIGTG